MNYIIIGKKRDRYQIQKDTSFDILSLANQLYRSKSTYPESPEYSKIYFLENQVPNLINLGLNHLSRVLKAYKEADQKDMVYKYRASILEDGAGNEIMDKLFR